MEYIFYKIFIYTWMSSTLDINVIFYGVEWIRIKLNETIKIDITLIISLRIKNQISPYFGKMNRRGEYETQTISSSDFSKFPHIDNEGCLIWQSWDSPDK